jgi:hypothetical protein
MKSYWQDEFAKFLNFLLGYCSAVLTVQNMPNITLRCFFYDFVVIIKNLSNFSQTRFAIWSFLRSNRP